MEYRALVGRSEEKRSLGRPIHRWEDKIKMFFNKWDEEAWTECSGSEEVQVAGSCECCNEPPDSIKCGEFLDWPRTR